MSKKCLNSLRKGREFIRHAECHKPAPVIRRGKGSHVVIETPRGEVVVPDGTDDLGKGIRCKLVKMFTLIGLASLTVGCLVVAVVGSV